MSEPNFKEKTPRDERYLDWIRSLPCDNCGYPPRSEAHHARTGGVALKCSDYLTVPLCGVRGRGCHGQADKGLQAEWWEIRAAAYRRYYLKEGQR